MVLTATQSAAFFQEEAQMGIPNPTVVQMQAEGITNVQDLADFDKESLQQLADNLRRPGGRVPDPNPNAAPGLTIATPAFVLGAKSQKRSGGHRPDQVFHCDWQRLHRRKPSMDACHEEF
jgi:hypothetical protein